MVFVQKMLKLMTSDYIIYHKKYIMYIIVLNTFKNVEILFKEISVSKKSFRQRDSAIICVTIILRIPTAQDAPACLPTTGLEMIWSERERETQESPLDVGTRYERCRRRRRRHGFASPVYSRHEWLKPNGARRRRHNGIRQFN